MQEMGQRSAGRRIVRRGLAGHGLALAAALTLAVACSGGGGGGEGGGDADGGGLFTNSGSGGSGSTATGGAVVAVLELEAPELSPFVLRGTIPVPPNTFPRTDGKVPLALRNVDGFVVPTQLEVVSRYADADAGADVLEVLGRVDLPPGTAPGQRVSYEVVEYVHPTGLLPLDQALINFLMIPGHALLVAEDVFGNRYQIDLLESVSAPEGQPRAKILRKGQAAVQLRTYNVMRPTGQNLGAPEGALPHFFGVHAYVTAWAETSALSLDLRVHNGFDGHDKELSDDDPLGKVYFKWLELWLPKGWVALQDVEDVAAGDRYEQGGWMRYPLIAPDPGGKLHVMPHQSHFQRRLGLARAEDVGAARSVVDDEALAFCRRGQAPSGADLWSWWNPQTARYFPQKHRLPDLSFLNYQVLEDELAATYSMARTALMTGDPGNFAVPSGALGWAHPWGVSYGGMTGGIEVHLYDGVQLAEVGTNEGWMGVRLTHRMVVDRQPYALYNIEGDPTSIEDWVQQGSFPYVEMNFWMNLIGGDDPFGFGDAPDYQVQHVAANGLQPDYEGALLGYMPIDFQHFVRYTRSPKVLAWLGNDALAKDDLRHAAEIVRMSMHEYPNSSGKTHTGSYLFGLASHVGSFPGKGIPWGRGEAWSVDAVVAAYSTGAPDYRDEVRPWLETCADLVAQGQIPCSGFIMAQYVSQWLTGQYLMRSQPEHSIIEHSLWGQLESVFRGADAARTQQTEQVVAEAARTVIGPISWSQVHLGPWFLAATAPLDPAQPSFCDEPPPDGVGSGIDGFFSWASFGYGWELTGDTEFLDKMTAMSGGSAALPGLLSQLAVGHTTIEMAAAVLAALQEP